jgi:membrane fusion protein, multidrug efflux system
LSTQATSPTAPAPTQSNTKGRRRAFLVFATVLLVVAAGALVWWLHARQFEETDDAQIDAHLNSITSRVDGTILAVYVENNQEVKTGQSLVDLDPRDFQVSLNQALAQLSQARSMVLGEQPNVPITQTETVTNVSNAESDVANAQASLAAAERDRDSSAAKLQEAEANNAKAQSDLERYKTLIAKEEVSQQDYDAVLATAKAQAAAVASSRASLQSADHMVDGRRAQLASSVTKLSQYKQTAPQQIAIRRAAVRSNQASAQSAQAQLEQAQLQLSYAKITAPVSGIVVKRSAEVGAHVSAGQQLLQIAQIHDLWVTANFKETQLRSIKPQQDVSIHVDALKQDFGGYVETLGGSTGAISSILPPENATGNYVKVVQRIPVRIRFRPNQAGLERLRPGMSVEPEVRIRD